MTVQFYTLNLLVTLWTTNVTPSRCLSSVTTVLLSGETWGFPNNPGLWLMTLSVMKSSRICPVGRRDTESSHSIITNPSENNLCTSKIKIIRSSVFFKYSKTRYSLRNWSSLTFWGYYWIVLRIHESNKSLVRTYWFCVGSMWGWCSRTYIHFEQNIFWMSEMREFSHRAENWTSLGTQEYGERSTLRM